MGFRNLGIWVFGGLQIEDLRDLEILIFRFRDFVIWFLDIMVFRDLGRFMHLGIWEFVDLRFYGFGCL